MLNIFLISNPVLFPDLVAYFSDFFNNAGVRYAAAAFKNSNRLFKMECKREFIQCSYLPRNYNDCVRISNKRNVPSWYSQASMLNFCKIVMRKSVLVYV